MLSCTELKSGGRCCQRHPCLKLLYLNVHCTLSTTSSGSHRVSFGTLKSTGSLDLKRAPLSGGMMDRFSHESCYTSYLINNKSCCDLFCNESPVMNVYKASRLPDLSTKTHKNQHTRSPLTPGSPFDPWKTKMLFKMTIPGVNKSHADSVWLLQSSTLYCCIIAETSRMLINPPIIR